MTDVSGGVVDAWPLCPECQAARVAVCRVCGAAKDFFPPAYRQEGENHELRFCTGCDDVAELQYFRHCHACGHDYGSGVVPEKPPPEEHENRGRVWLLVVALVGGAGLLAAYFYSLFRR